MPVANYDIVAIATNKLFLFYLETNIYFFISKNYNIQKVI